MAQKCNSPWSTDPGVPVVSSVGCMHPPIVAGKLKACWWVGLASVWLAVMPFAATAAGSLVGRVSGTTKVNGECQKWCLPGLGQLDRSR